MNEYTEYKPNRPLRSVGSSHLEIPRVHTKQTEFAFSYFAAHSWNQLPEEIRCAKTLATRGVEINRFYGALRCRRGRIGIGSVIDNNRL